jgi:hypothetical protein
MVVWKRGQAKQPLLAWCPQCAAQVRMVTLEEAMPLTGRSLRAICREVEAGHLHFSETADGQLFICLNSLRTQT